MMRKAQLNDILWDNTKTAVYHGGRPLGVLISALPQVFFVLLSTAIWPGFEEPRNGNFKKYFDRIGTVGGVLGGGISAPVSILLLALPFSVISLKTRKFRSDEDIQLGLNNLANITDPETQRRIIKHVCYVYTEASFGLMSYESVALLQTLSTGPSIEKWPALNLYIQSRSSTGEHSNNGKKLFNIILDTVLACRPNAAPSFEELQALFRLLQRPEWQMQGRGFFSKSLPRGIFKLQEYFRKRGIFSEEDIDGENAQSLTIDLKTIIYERGSCRGRSETTMRFYEAIKNLGAQGNINNFNLPAEWAQQRPYSTVSLQVFPYVH